MGRVYDLQQWRRVRREQLTKEPLCRHCKAHGISKPASQVDHIQRINDGGAWFDDDNLQSLCHECHSRKTAREDGKVLRSGCDVNGLPLDGQHHWYS